MNIINTPLGPIDPADRSPVTENYQDPQVSAYPSTSPWAAYQRSEDQNIDRPTEMEFARIRRLSFNRDKVTMCHRDWRFRSALTYDEQMSLAMDGYAMQSLLLPWFLDRFYLEHAQTIKSAFPHRRIFFESEEIFI